MNKPAVALFLAIALLAAALNDRLFAAEEAGVPHVIMPGDSWSALAWAAETTPVALLHRARTLNPDRWPAIGITITLPVAPRSGTLLRPQGGGLLETALRHGRSPWALAGESPSGHPYRPPFGAALIAPGGGNMPRDLPPDFVMLIVSPQPAQPGQALALQATYGSAPPPGIALEDQPWPAALREGTLVALGGTGAFYPPGQPLLVIKTGRELWQQPLLLAAGEWTFEQLTFTGTAVFNAEEIRLERERLQAIWDTFTPRPLWRGSFTVPIDDYVALSSLYGARRSVNGGPYSSYHEGTDFSAYAGTAVSAPAAGRVVLAEKLNVRGNAVILDHGLGLHSGYYHLSTLHARPGQMVQQGDLLGEVGSTGRSTGNHLHWDLLVGRTWVDPQAWAQGDSAAAISAVWPASTAASAPARQHDPRP